MGFKISKKAEDALGEVNLSAYKIGTIQGFISLLHEFRNKGISEPIVMEEIMQYKVMEYDWNKPGRGAEKRTQFPPVHWGLCKDCHIQMVLRFGPDCNVIECPKCFYSKIVEQSDSHRPLSKKEVDLFIR